MNKYETMFLNPELRPYLAAINILEHRLSGIELYWPELVFSINVEYPSEEALFVALLTQNVFDFVISNEHGHSWNVVFESFQEFLSNSASIKCVCSNGSTDMFVSVYSWLISLCDWDCGLHRNSSKH